MGMLFCFVLFSNSEKRKKSESAMQPAAWMFSSFLSQSSSSSIQTQKAIQQQGWEHWAREGVTSSHLSMYLIVHHLSMYFPHTISSHWVPRPGCQCHDLHDIILSFSTPYIYNFVLFFNFSQTVVAMRLSLWLWRVVENTCWNN